MKNLSIKTIIVSAILFLFTSCSPDIKGIKSGEMVHIPFSRNYAVGTDSTIVIISRKNGKTLNTINRK